MWRDGAAKTDASIPDLIPVACAKRSHRSCIVVLFNAGLNGLPINQISEVPIAMHERGGRDRLADVRIRAGYEETAEHGASVAQMRAAHEAKRRRVVSSRPALTEMRNRDV